MRIEKWYNNLPDDVRHEITRIVDENPQDMNKRLADIAKEDWSNPPLWVANRDEMMGQVIASYVLGLKYRPAVDWYNREITESEYMQHQKWLINLMERFESTDRKTIKANLRRMTVKSLKAPSDVIELGFSTGSVRAWFGRTSDAYPIFKNALIIANAFKFDMDEYLKETKDSRNMVKVASNDE